MFSGIRPELRERSRSRGMAGPWVSKGARSILETDVWPPNSVCYVKGKINVGLNIVLGSCSQGKGIK